MRGHILPALYEESELVEKTEREMIEALLQGKTMSIYALLLTKGKMGVREVSRELSLSSPSLALHHLTKLVEGGIVVKDNHGEYRVQKEVFVGSMTLFVKIGKYLMPRFVFLVSLVSLVLAAYSLWFFSLPIDGTDVLFISTSVIVIIVLLLEIRRIWTLRPF